MFEISCFYFRQRDSSSYRLSRNDDYSRLRPDHLRSSPRPRRFAGFSAARGFLLGIYHPCTQNLLGVPYNSPKFKNRPYHSCHPDSCSYSYVRVHTLVEYKQQYLYKEPTRLQLPRRYVEQPHTEESCQIYDTFDHYPKMYGNTNQSAKPYVATA